MTIQREILNPQAKKEQMHKPNKTAKKQYFGSSTENQP